MGAQTAAVCDESPSRSRTIQVPVFLWEKHPKHRTLTACRVIPVEEGAPLIWALGRFGRFCADMLRLVVDPFESDGLRFEIKGAEVFWFTPVESPVAIHVYRNLE